MVINQGDVFWVPLKEPDGSEPGFVHPHVVIQDDVLNGSRIKTVVVCALTTNLKRAKAPGNVLLEREEANLPRQSAVIVSQVSTVEKTQLGEYIGSLSRERVDQILAGMQFLQSITAHPEKIAKGRERPDKTIMEFEEISTSRLLIRPFQERDALSLFEYLSNPDVYRFEPGDPISMEKAMELTLERTRSIDFLAVILKSTQKMVGHLYFKQVEPKEFLTWELGYIFHPGFHNQGYATESAGALIRHGFQHFGIHRIIAHCNPENIASWKVLEKLGMKREGCFRKNIFFRKAQDGSPIWLDSFEYAMLKEDIKSSGGHISNH